MSKKGKQHVSQRERSRRARQSRAVWEAKHPVEATFQRHLRIAQLQQALGIKPERPWELRRYAEDWL